LVKYPEVYEFNVGSVLLHIYQWHASLSGFIASERPEILNVVITEFSPNGVTCTSNF